MHSSIRTFALPLSFIAVAALGACNSEATDRGKDVLAQDSTLDLAVLNASGDSVGHASGDTNLGARASAPAATSAPSSLPASAPVRVVTTAQSQQTTASTPVHISTPVAHKQVRPSRSGRLVSTSHTPAPRASAIPVENSPVIVPARVKTSKATSAVIPTGSSFSLVTEQKICASSAKIGDSFDASLAKEVVSPSGVVIPAGTPATGEVVSTAGKNSTMRVALKSIDFDGHSYPVSSDVTFTDMQRVKIQPKGGSTSRILAGAGIGAIIGRVMGGSAKSTIIGAAGGAAAGGVVAAKSVHYDQCVPEGGQIIAHLAQPLRVQLGD